MAFTKVWFDMQTNTPGGGVYFCLVLIHLFTVNNAFVLTLF